MTNFGKTMRGIWLTSQAINFPRIQGLDVCGHIVGVGKKAFTYPLEKSKRLAG